MAIFIYQALRKYIVCQGFYLTSRLKTVRTRSGNLGWDATLKKAALEAARQQAK